MNRKTTKIVLITLIFLANLAYAIPNPAPIYCEQTGYEIQNDSCVFPDGERCEQWAFYRGECGQKYVKNLSCTELGEPQLPGHVCCEGLTPITRAVGSERGCAIPMGAWPVCAACGDGVCNSKLENKCNCPKDCEEEVIEDEAVCQNNEDCEPFFSHCSCSWTCVEKSGEARVDCKRICPKEEDILSEKPSCACEKGGCRVSQVDSEPLCDVSKPCPEGLTCIRFPEEGVKCAKENPCRYYECPKGLECIVAESYPPKVYCSRPSQDMGEQQTVSYDVDTGEVTVSSSQGEVEVLIQRIGGNRGLIKTSKAQAVSMKPISIEEKSLVMKTSSGKKEPVKLLPEDAVRVINGKTEDEVSEIVLAEVEEKPTYNLVLAKKTKFLGLIPVNMQYQAQVDAQTGNKISVKKPWWHILTFELFNNKGNPQTGLEEARVIAGDRVV
ncbi:MAG: DUF333 domain-containing protein, partial [Candidatus Altiarchaeales archaeon]|nr:DUF333 domain-containing protein [Candidatus Altiarchaeales archaeon]